MIQLVESLTKVPDKISQEDYDRIYNLYIAKKSQITLDGEIRVVIYRLSSKFPVVSTASSGKEVEYSSKTVERILNTTCKFKS